MKTAIEATAYPLMSFPDLWHGTERAVGGLAERLPATLVDDLKTAWWDVAIACEDSTKLVNSRARKRIFWTSMSDFNAEAIQMANHCVFESQYHVDLALKTKHNLSRKQCVAIPYATDAAPTTPKVSGRLLWGSSPDRGLHHALRIFKQAKEKMPDLTFEVTYSLGSMRERRWDHSTWGLRAVEIDSLLGQEGVICREHIARQDMLRAISEAEILLYPFDPIAPTELFGLIVLESMACGTIPLLSESDCFPSLWGTDAPILKMPIDDAEWVAAIEWLRDTKVGDEYREKGYARAQKHTWDTYVDEWRRLING